MATPVVEQGAIRPPLAGDWGVREEDGSGRCGRCSGCQTWARIQSDMKYLRENGGRAEYLGAPPACANQQEPLTAVQRVSLDR